MCSQNSPNVPCRKGQSDENDDDEWRIIRRFRFSAYMVGEVGENFPPRRVMCGICGMSVGSKRDFRLAPPEARCAGHPATEVPSPLKALESPDSF